MSTSTKITIAIASLGLLALVALVAYEKAVPGAVIASVAGMWAAFKAKLFGPDADDIRAEHKARRDAWSQLERDFDDELRPLKARIGELEQRSLDLEEQLQMIRGGTEQRVEQMREKWSSDDRARYLDDVLRNL